MDFALSSDAIAIIGILALMMIAMVGGYISLVRRIASLPTRDEFNATWRLWKKGSARKFASQYGKAKR